MEGWFECSDGIMCKERGAHFTIPDLSHKSKHIVYIHSTKKPLTEDRHCFEVEITKQAKDAYLAIGLSKECFLDPDALRDDENEEKAADKRPDSVAYFSDDGTVCSTAKEAGKDHLPTYNQGDIITFYLDYLMPEKSLVGIFKNRQLVCRRWVTLDEDSVLPTINAWWGPIELSVKWQSDLSIALSHSDLEQWRIPDTVTIKDDLLLMRNSFQTTTVQSPVCFDDDFSYFEVKLISMGESGGQGPVVGLSSATYTQSQYPGSTYESVGLATTEGYVYQDKRKHTAMKTACPCSEGDTIGCGVLYAQQSTDSRRSSQKVVIYFTRNQEVVHHGVFDQSPGGYYPAIGMQSSGCSVQISTTCPIPPLPDSGSWLKKVNSSFSGLPVGVVLPKSSGPKHEDGLKEGCYRFSALIGLPENDIITPKEAIKAPGNMIQKLSPLTPEMPLFTMEIIDGDDSGTVCIGVSSGEQSVGCLPGSLVGSVGYVSTGKVLIGSVSHVSTTPYEQGDVIGCYVEYFDSATSIQFIKNGQLVGQAQVKGAETDLYPSVGFVGNPTSVRLKWPHAKPELPPVYTQTNLSNWLCGSGMKLSGNTLSVSKKTRKLEGLWFFSPQPLSKDWSYFEVMLQNEVLPTATEVVPKAPWFGVSNNFGHMKFKDFRRIPDARAMSYLCNSNGVAFVNAMMQNIDFQTSHVKKGDRLGFGIWFPEEVSQLESRKSQVVVVYICLNGTIFWWQAFEQLSGGLYPFICLYRYGDVVSISHQCPPPPIETTKAWKVEADALKEQLHQQQKLGQKETACTRRNRPSSPVKRTNNGLNKHRVYLHCDTARYNEATYIQARLHSKGLTTTLSDKSSLSTPIPEPSVKLHDAIVVCIGPEGAGSARIQNVIEEARELGVPVIPVILETMQWPPFGPLKEELSLLTMERIEMQSDFYWGCDQIAEYIQRLVGQGYNGRAVNVDDGKGATQLYSDAQRGKHTTNEKSDPNALKKAVEDADKRKLVNPGGDNRPASSQEVYSQRKMEDTKRAKSAGARPKSSQRTSKTCTLL